MAERDWVKKNYYEILGVPKDASTKEIEDAYRLLARVHRSAVEAGESLEIPFSDVSEAHAVLADDQRRHAYDQLRTLVEDTGPPGVPATELPRSEVPAPGPRRPSRPPPPPPKGRKRPAWVAVALVGCAAFLVGGFLFKANCLVDFNDDAYRWGCYNDLQPLFGPRLFADGERVFPYIHAEFVDIDGDGSEDLANGAIEYPVLTGVFMYLSGLLADDPGAFLKWSALLLAPFALITAFFLARMAAWRALLWSLAPAIVLYSFHNWDLLVVAAAVAGIYLWWRDQPIWAAVLFGIGGALKLYPIFFLAPLVLDLWVGQRRRDAVRAGIAGGATLLAINLPFMIANFEGWSITYSFHEGRGPNFDTIWCTMRDDCLKPPFWEPSTLNLLTAVLTGAFFIVALGYGLIRARREGRYPFLPVCGALLATFLLWNKVHSPQYALWLLPFFVLIRVHVLWWIGYAIADLMVYIGVFRWFDTFQRPSDFPALEVMNAGIWARAAFLLALFVVFLRSSSAHASEPAPSVALKEWLSQPLRRAPAHG
ncbi:MAG: DnaJ domain-containing protein [Actinomycetota bacterium]